MFGASGSYGWSQTKSKSKSDYWTGQQKRAERQLGQYLTSQDLTKGAPRYTGQLAGTYTPGMLTNLFQGAEQYSKGGPLTRAQAGPWAEAPPEGSQLFAHYAQYADPAQREQQIASRLEARRRLLAPEREKEDSAMKAKMRAMGMEYSSDMLKKQADIEATRQAEEDLISSDLLDKYEQLGYQAGQDAMAAIQGIGSMQYEIKNAGLEAEFNEWLRTQPEYSPMLDTIMRYLGLQGKSSTSGRETTQSFSASASYMSDLSVKKEIVDLTPIAFKFKEGLGQDDQVHIGVIAQEVERLYPHLVQEKEVDGRMIKHVDYQTLCAILLLALKARS